MYMFVCTAIITFWEESYKKVPSYILHNRMKKSLPTVSLGEEWGEKTFYFIHNGEGSPSRCNAVPVKFTDPNKRRCSYVRLYRRFNFPEVFIYPFPLSVYKLTCSNYCSIPPTDFHHRPHYKNKIGWNGMRFRKILRRKWVIVIGVKWVENDMTLGVVSGFPKRSFPAHFTLSQ